MSDPRRNQTNGVPRADWDPKYLVRQEFPAERPIFWGPNQDTTYPSTYNPPSNWRENQLLSITRTVRIFFGDGGFVTPTVCRLTRRTFTPYPEFSGGELAQEFSIEICVPCAEDQDIELIWSASNPSVTFHFTGALPTVDELNALIDAAGGGFAYGPFESSSDTDLGAC